MLISTIFSKRKFTISMILLSIILLAVVPFFSPPYMIISLITILMYTILTLSWTMFSGPTNYISLATAALFGVGVYASAVLNELLPLFIIIIISGLLSFLLALSIGMLTLRLKGVYFILFTFGMTALIRNTVQWWETHITLTVGRHVVSPGNNTVYMYMVVIYALTLIFIFLLQNSSYGMALKGIGENEDASEHIGIDVTRLKVIVFALSALFMGAAGAVMATRWRYIDPNVAFNPLLSFLPVLMAIFGGTWLLGGPILGAVTFTMLQEYLITKYPYLYMLLMGLTLILVILFLPGGLLTLVMKGYIWLVIQWAKTKWQWQVLTTRWKEEWRPKVSMWLAQWRLRWQWRLGRKRQ
jgi:branched-chain amino acid transport system permease protein